MSDRAFAARVAAMAVMTGALLALAHCKPEHAAETASEGLSCTAAEDCPFYMTCAEGACRYRCYDDHDDDIVARCDRGENKTGICRNRACVPP
jgi:hypothetical protein